MVLTVIERGSVLMRPRRPRHERTRPRSLTSYPENLAMGFHVSTLPLSVFPDQDAEWHTGPNAEQQHEEQG